MTRRGLTLLEVLLAIALIGGLLSAMFLFLWDILETRHQIARVTQRIDAAIALIDGVGQDLVTTIVGDQIAGSGIRGDATTLTLLTRGVSAHHVPDPALPLADLQEHVYRHNENARQLELRRRVVGVEDTGDFLPVDADVARVRFRYHDGSSWQDAFDSLAAGRLPHAVEIAVWFETPASLEMPPDPRDESERTTFDVAGGFDEDAFLRESDIDIDDLPPDRVRVIAIPDAAAPASPNDAVEEPAS